MTKISKAIVVVTSLTLGACGFSTSKKIAANKKVHQAPRSNSETGVIVSGLPENEMAELLEQSEKNGETLTVRRVNPAHN